MIIIIIIIIIILFLLRALPNVDDIEPLTPCHEITMEITKDSEQVTPSHEHTGSIGERLLQFQLDEDPTEENLAVRSHMLWSCNKSKIYIKTIISRVLVIVCILITCRGQ